MPSYREGFGSVLLEAAASSLPIISTNIDGPRDFIRHKVNGYLVEPKNVESLRIALDYFRDNKSELKKYAMKALEIVNEKYNVDYVSNLFVRDLLLVLIPKAFISVSLKRILEAIMKAVKHIHKKIKFRQSKVKFL